MKNVSQKHFNIFPSFGKKKLFKIQYEFVINLGLNIWLFDATEKLSDIHFWILNEMFNENIPIISNRIKNDFRTRQARACSSNNRLVFSAMCQILEFVQI